MSDDLPDLVELHRYLAALVNNRCHFDLVDMPEIERIVQISDVLDDIESALGGWDRSA